MLLTSLDNSRFLFKCSCCDGHGCDQFIELYLEKDEYWFHVVSYPANLWMCLHWWWRHKKTWRSDLMLKKVDLIKLRELLEKI